MSSYPLLNVQNVSIWDISANNVTLVSLNGSGDASGQYLKSNGTSVAPSFSTIRQSTALNNLYTPFYPNSKSYDVSGGIIAQTIDPTTCFTSTSFSVGTIAYLNSIYLYTGSVITNIIVSFQTAATAGSMYLGLYNSAGVRVAVTALTSTVQTNNIVTPFTSAYTVPTSGFYYCAFMIASGTNPTVFVSPNNSSLQAGALINYPQVSSVTVTSGTNLLFRVANTSVTGSLPIDLSGNIVSPSRYLLYFGLN